MRDPGDAVLLAAGFSRVSPSPLAGGFGRLEFIGRSLAAGTAGSRGYFDFTFPDVPAQATGATVHFQCVALAAGEFYLSADGSGNAGKIACPPAEHAL